jgi:hypothetical protein
MFADKIHAVHRLSAVGLRNKQSTRYDLQYAIDITLQSELIYTTSSVKFPQSIARRSS